MEGYIGRMPQTRHQDNLRSQDDIPSQPLYPSGKKDRPPLHPHSIGKKVHSMHPDRICEWNQGRWRPPNFHSCAEAVEF
eukprot:scaffold425_cov175-Amphora_coffeaeformis.AAC.75